MKRKLLWMALLAGVVLTGCKKDNGGTPPPVDPETVGYFILMQGYQGSVPGALAWYDAKTEELPTNYFTYNGNTGNPVPFGDTPQDLLVYGTKAYCSVWGEDRVVVLDAESGRILNVISVEGKPRYLTSAEGNVYVSTYEKGVARIDTTRMTVSGTAPVSGAFCEGIAALNGKLYVANNGYDKDSQTQGTTVSVIDLGTFRETGQIEVPVNPNTLGAGKDGYIYLITLGIYNPELMIMEGGGLHRIDPVAGRVIHTFEGLDAAQFALHEGYAYTCFTDYASWPWKGSAKKVDLKTNQVSDFITDAPTFNAVSVNPLTGEVFYTYDGEDYSGALRCYSASGAMKYELSGLGTNPTQVAFVIK